MIPSLNALKTALRFLLLDRVDVHHSVSTLEITDPRATSELNLLRGAEHDLLQVCKMLMQMVEEREEMHKPIDNEQNTDYTTDHE